MFSAAARRSFDPRTFKARRTVGSVTDSGGLLIRRSAVNKQYAPSDYYSEHPQRVQRIVHEPLRQRARWLISRKRPPRAEELPSGVHLYFLASFHSTLLLMPDDARDFCQPRWSLTRFYVAAPIPDPAKWPLGAKIASVCAARAVIRLFVAGKRKISMAPKVRASEAASAKAIRQLAGEETARAKSTSWSGLRRERHDVGRDAFRLLPIRAVAGLLIDGKACRRQRVDEPLLLRPRKQRVLVAPQ